MFIWHFSFLNLLEFPEVNDSVLLCVKMLFYSLDLHSMQIPSESSGIIQLEIEH